jgi:DNA-directed RNA polymerase specialized sigma24 family protein
VYGAVAPRVDAVCARILGAGPDADDAAQRALIRVFERVDTFDPARGSALSWILTTAALQARTVRRERGRRAGREVREVEVAACDDDDPRAELLALIAPLDATDRHTILAAIGDLPRPDAPPATFRKRLQRALDRLRRRMLDLGER